MITKLLEGLPNQSMQQGAFDEAVGKYMADLPTWGAEANALAADVNAKQATATAKAASAADQVPLATAQANNAANSAEVILTYVRPVIKLRADEAFHARLRRSVYWMVAASTSASLPT